MTNTNQYYDPKTDGIRETIETKTAEWKKLNRELGKLQDKYGYDGPEQISVCKKMLKIQAETEALEKSIDLVSDFSHDCEGL